MRIFYSPYLKDRLNELDESDAIEEKRLARRVRRIKVRFLKGTDTQ